MATNALVPESPAPAPAASDQDPDLLAERHLVHRMITWTAMLIPAGSAFFALLVGIAVRDTGVPVIAPVLMGAGIGVLAGLFFGMWAGFVASDNEFQTLEHP